MTDPVEASIAELARLSLIELDEDFDPRMHRLIGAFVALKIPAGDELRQSAVDAVRAEMSRAEDDADTHSYADLEKVLPHAEWLIKASFVQQQDASAIADKVRWHHRKHGRYRLAETFAQKALALAQSAFEPGHPSIATRQSNLALVLKDLGELEEARDLLWSSYSSLKRWLGHDHPSTKTVEGNLAAVDAAIAQ